MLCLCHRSKRLMLRLQCGAKINYYYSIAVNNTTIIGKRSTCILSSFCQQPRLLMHACFIPRGIEIDIVNRNSPYKLTVLSPGFGCRHCRCQRESTVSSSSTTCTANRPGHSPFTDAPSRPRRLCGVTAVVMATNGTKQQSI